MTVNMSDQESRDYRIARAMDGRRNVGLQRSSRSSSLSLRQLHSSAHPATASERMLQLVKLPFNCRYGEARDPAVSFLLMILEAYCMCW